MLLLALHAILMMPFHASMARCGPYDCRLLQSLSSVGSGWLVSGVHNASRRLAYVHARLDCLSLLLLRPLSLPYQQARTSVYVSTWSVSPYHHFHWERAQVKWQAGAGRRSPGCWLARQLARSLGRSRQAPPKPLPPPPWLGAHTRSPALPSPDAVLPPAPAPLCRHTVRHHVLLRRVYRLLIKSDGA